MKLAELFENKEFEKELLNLQALRGRKDVEYVKDLIRKMPDGKKGAKNVERGFRNDLKRQYKKIDVKEE